MRILKKGIQNDNQAVAKYSGGKFPKKSYHSFLNGQTGYFKVAALTVETQASITIFVFYFFWACYDAVSPQLIEIYSACNSCSSKCHTKIEEFKSNGVDECFISMLNQVPDIFFSMLSDSYTLPMIQLFHTHIDQLTSNIN